MRPYPTLALAFAVVGAADLLVARRMATQRRGRAGRLFAAVGALSIGLAAAFLYLSLR